MTAIRKLASRFTEADIDDEIILMRLDNGELLSLADSAAATWRLIDGERDRRAVVAALAAQYVVDDQQIAADVAELLHELMEAGLLAED
jgi:hypothetical protein